VLDELVQKYHILPQQFDPVPLPPPTDSCDDHASGFESDGGAVVRSSRHHRSRAYSGPRDPSYHGAGGPPYHQPLARSQPALAYAVHGGGGTCRDDCGAPRPLGDGVSATSAAVLRGGRDGAGALANSTHSVARSYAGGPPLSTSGNSTSAAAAALRHQTSLSLPPNQFARHPVRENGQDGPKKRGHRLMTIILSNLNRFKNFFHWKIPW